MISWRPVACALALALGAGGCAAHGPTTRITSLATATPVAAPSGSMTWASVGFTYGPQSLVLPQGLTVERRVDQANVATLFFRTPDGPAAVRWFRTALPAAGFVLDTDSPDAILCHDATWSCALATGGDGLTGLTFRRQG